MSMRATNSLFVSTADVQCETVKDLFSEIKRKKISLSRYYFGYFLGLFLSLCVSFVIFDQFTLFDCIKKVSKQSV